MTVVRFSKTRYRKLTDGRREVRGGMKPKTLEEVLAEEPDRSIACCG
jgi:hypothetical protein